MQDIGGGDAVDDFGAALAGQVGGDHLALTAAVDSRSSHNAIGRSRKRHEIAGELAHRLGARPVAAGQGQRQPDHQPADACAIDQREQPRHVVAKAPPADGFERAGDDAGACRTSARPIVLVPTSSPISRKPAGTASRKCRGVG